MPVEELAGVMVGAGCCGSGLTALHQRLAAEARQGLARRRGHVAADRLASDAWLVRLAASLVAHRAGAVECWGC
ncbi:MAG: hypothetical protein WCK65_13975 [Rhodospirillaceae bacterium]